jgi:hypothetical protein
MALILWLDELPTHDDDEVIQWLELKPVSTHHSLI